MINNHQRVPRRGAIKKHKPDFLKIRNEVLWVKLEYARYVG